MINIKDIEIFRHMKSILLIVTILFGIGTYTMVEDSINHYREFQNIKSDPPSYMEEIFDIFNVSYESEVTYLKNYERLDYQTNTTHSKILVMFDIMYHPGTFEIIDQGNGVYLINAPINNYNLSILPYTFDGYTYDEYSIEQSYRANIQDNNESNDPITSLDSMIDFQKWVVIDTPSPLIVDETKKQQLMNEFNFKSILTGIYAIIFGLSTLYLIFVLYIVFTAESIDRSKEENNN